jgi:hypothetical protein
MKVCSKCGIEKEQEEFRLVWPAKQDGRLRPDCKECMCISARAAYHADPTAQKERMKLIGEAARKASKEFIQDYLKSHPCVDCGESDSIVLDFDHVRGEKEYDVSRLVNQGARLWKIIKEIEKCEVRCANCHRRITHKRRGADVQQPACLPSKENESVQIRCSAPIFSGRAAKTAGRGAL